MKVTETVQSVERAIDLLNCFSPQQPELALNDFVKKTSLNRTTAFRLLNSLKNKNLITKNEEKNTYSLGIAFINFGQIVSENLDIRKVALPALHKLAERTKETVSLNIIQDLDRVCIEKAEGTEDIRQFIRLGHPYPILKGASGKLLLAFSSPDFIEQAMTEGAYEDNRNRDEFLHQLLTIKQQGYAFSMNERVIGAYAISAPIFGNDGSLVGGLSISGSSARMNDKMQNQFIQDAMQAAQKISQQMGYIPQTMD